MAERTVKREVLIGIGVTVVGGLIVAILVAVLRIGAPADAGLPSPSPSAPDSESSTPGGESEPSESSPTESTSAAPEPTPDTLPAWLADVDPMTDVGLWNSVTGTMRSKSYIHSLVVPTEWGDGQTSWATWALDGAYAHLTGLVGIEDGGHASETAVFEIVLDGSTVAEYQVSVGGTPQPIDLSLDGVRDLTLRVTNVSQSAYAAEAVFADFRVE